MPNWTKYEEMRNQRSDLFCTQETTAFVFLFFLSLQQNQCWFRKEELMDNRSGEFEFRAGYNKEFLGKKRRRDPWFIELGNDDALAKTQELSSEKSREHSRELLDDTSELSWMFQRAANSRDRSRERSTTEANSCERSREPFLWPIFFPSVKDKLGFPYKWGSGNLYWNVS